MKYDAVIFDLFGTLVDNFDSRGYHAMLAEMSGAIEAETEAFRRGWTDRLMLERRFKGELATPADTIRLLCAQLGLSPPPASVQRAQEIRLGFTRRALTPRPDAVDALTGLRQAGLKLALLSNCSGDVPHFWPQTPLAGLFDAVLLSCREGMVKPEPAFYALACERLDVPAQRCLYVADGDGDELTGARRAGMTAVLLCAPHEKDLIMARPQARDWTGPIIEYPSDVLRLVR